MTEYPRGLIYPPAKPLSITSGPPWPPTWLALTVAPQKEKATRDHLRAKGIACFFPSKETTRTQWGKRITTERPIVSGYVFAKFKQQPDWDYLKRVHRLITGVVARNGLPVEIHPDVIRHLRGMTVEADKLAEARLEMMRLRSGDKARIMFGPLKEAGFSVVEIGLVKEDKALVDMVFGGKVWVTIASLERIVDKP